MITSHAPSQLVHSHSWERQNLALAPAQATWKDTDAQNFNFVTQSGSRNKKPRKLNFGAFTRRSQKFRPPPRKFLAIRYTGLNTEVRHAHTLTHEECNLYNVYMCIILCTLVQCVCTLVQCVHVYNIMHTGTMCMHTCTMCVREKECVRACEWEKVGKEKILCTSGEEWEWLRDEQENQRGVGVVWGCEGRREEWRQCEGVWVGGRAGSGRRRGVQAGGSRVDSGEEVWRGYTSRGEQTSHYMTLYIVHVGGWKKSPWAQAN